MAGEELSEKEAHDDAGACAYPWQQMIIDLTGEVVPCCFWSGYGNGGRPLGNTNVQTPDEIWNGPGYRDLRRRNAAGDLRDHPCGSCLARTWAKGHAPGFTWPMELRREDGHCWLAALPAALLPAGPDAPPARLLEDGRELQPGDALHDDIRRLGGGRFSAWGGWLYFSSSDNSDPLLNGRRYELVRGAARHVICSLDTRSASGANLVAAHAEYRAGAETLQARPTMLSFISTADCNIDCPACSQNTVRLAKVQHRPETEAAVLALVPGLVQFIWHGGEPWLIRGLRSFVDGFRPEHNPHLAFGFTSNATLLDADELAKLERFPRINASLSVDSFVRETFERVRAGARFDTVLANVLRAVRWSDPPRRTMSVGMIVCKSNVLELAHNLAFAMEHDIGLNLSPVVVYPVTEQLDVFEDFAAESRGWERAVEEAQAVVARARAAGRPALSRVDPEGMLAALGEIVRAAAARHAREVAVRLLVEDPTGALARMRRPGLIAYVGGRAVAYVALRGAGEHVLRLPAVELAGESDLIWALCHDLLEPMGVLDQDVVTDERNRSLPTAAWRSLPRTLALQVPPFAGVPRPRNPALARGGLSTPDGLRVTDPQDIFRAYSALAVAEIGRVPGPASAPRWRARRVTPGRYRDFAAPEAG